MSPRDHLDHDGDGPVYCGPSAFQARFSRPAHPQRRPSGNRRALLAVMREEDARREADDWAARVGGDGDVSRR